MNKIKDIYKSISSAELKQAILELEEDGVKGVYRTEGILRKYAKMFAEITGNPLSTDLFMTEIGLYKEAAHRWANGVHHNIEPYVFRYSDGSCKERCNYINSGAMIGSITCRNCSHNKGYSDDWIKCDVIALANK